MDRLLLISAVFFISFSSWAGTKEDIQMELKQAEDSQMSLYRKLRASMGEAIVEMKPKSRHKLKIGPVPTEYKIELIKQNNRLAKSQKHSSKSSD